MEDAVCVSCSSLLQKDDTPIQALCSNWHRNCFKCSECKRQLSSTYYARGKTLYCKKDYTEKFRSKCHVCEQKISGLVVVVADHKFHTECFSCGNCQQFLGEEDDYVLLEQHRLTCCTCFMKGKEESWWNPSLHAVHHLNLTPGALSNHKIEVEIVKRERKRSIKSRSLEKEPEKSLVIKGYSHFVTQLFCFNIAC